MSPSFHVVTYDEDGNPLLNKKTEVNLITAVRRESSYEPFTKDFYPNDTSSITDEIKAWEEENEVEIHNLLSDKEMKTPAPCLHFNELGFPAKLLSLIQKHNFVSPTPIQVPLLPSISLGGLAPTRPLRPQRHRQQSHRQRQDLLLRVATAPPAARAEVVSPATPD